MQEKSTVSTLSPSMSTTRRASLKFIFAPVQHNMPPPSTTNKIILDYLLYLSIQSRLKQAQIELLELATPLQEKDKDAIQVRKQRWVATATKAEQDKNAVESIVTGILSSHRNKRPSFQIDSHFEQRLHLCQLTNLVFGRLDTSSANTSHHHAIHHSSSTRRRRRRYYYQHQHQHQHEDASTQQQQQQQQGQQQGQQQDQGDTASCRWTHMIIPNYCRRHRLQRCVTCQDTTNSNKSLPLHLPPGLVEAIPTFLKTSADMLRQTLEADNDDDDEDDDLNSKKKKPLIFAGQKVMGGGMPPRWYDLFLELLTQAAIESYLCDMQTGLESIYEIFSYGDVEDEDEPDHHANDHDNDNDNDNENDNDNDLDDSPSNDASPQQQQQHQQQGLHQSRQRTADDDDDDEEEESETDWGVKAADHHLLFPKTRTMYLFKTQVREREKEFLVIEKDASLHDHFAKLAKRYPLENFEKNMGEFIQMIHNTMVVPALDNKYDDNGQHVTSNSSFDSPSTSISATKTKMTSTSNPSVYKYPGDGSLLMPEIPDEDDDDNDTDHVPANNNDTDDSNDAQQKANHTHTDDSIVVDSHPGSNKRRASVSLVKEEETKKPHLSQ